MSERNITIFEYHSHGDGPRFLPNLFRSSESDEDPTEVDETDDSGRGLAPLLVLGLLVAAAVGYRYYRSEDGEAEYGTDQVEVTEYEN